MKLNIVAPRTGLAWVRMGLRTYFRQPLALTGLFFMYTTVVLLLAVVPGVGVVIGGMLVPAATLGLMAATAETEKGRFPLPSVLLSAFRAGRQRLRAMLVLGAIYAAGSLLATSLATLLAGGAPQPAGAEAQMTGFEPAMGLAFVFHLPLFLMFWHAPALVHWHGVPPAKSLFFSAVAVLRNLGAHLLFAAGWLALFLAAGSVFGLIGALVGGAAAAQALVLPMALVLASMFSSSIYFSFRGCFPAEADEAAAEAPRLS